MTSNPNNDFLGADDLDLVTDNRLAVCLCLDTSGSMAHDDAIDQLNKGVEAFMEYIKDHEKTANSVELGIVTFDSEVKVVREFALVEDTVFTKLTAQNGTALAHGVEKALDMLEARKLEYKQHGRAYYQPMLVIFTDGKPGDKEDIPAAQQRCMNLITSKKLTCIAASVGNDVDEAKVAEINAVLKGFTPKVIHIKDLRFEEFFEWLGQSSEAYHDSAPGEKVTLPKPQDDFFDIDV